MPPSPSVRVQGDAIRRARRARVRGIRRRAVAGALALFVATWMLITLMLVTGHDPALARNTAKTASATSSGSGNTTVTTGASGTAAKATMTASTANSTSSTASGTGSNQSSGTSSLTSSQS